MKNKMNIMSKKPNHYEFNYSEIKNINEIIHSPPRLAILTFLLTRKTVPFSILAKALDLTGGNLSTHLKKLNENNLVEIEKKFVDLRPTTLISITSNGREVIKQYAQSMSDILKGILEKSK